MRFALASLLFASSYALTLAARAYEASSDYESPEEYPYMGDWEGQWVNPRKGHEEHDPALAAQIICIGIDRYRIRLMPKLYLRAEPYLDTELTLQEGRLELHDFGWNADFRPAGFTGTALLHGDETAFTLKRVEKGSPTLGAKPPSGAVVLFDGANVDAWQHDDGRAVTWKVTDAGAMQILSHYWNDGKNGEQGLGGNIVTKRTFGSMRLHLEFRYPVEPDKAGQMRGNSGIFLTGLPEIQLLNSYGLHGYWNECGALYHVLPPKVNAAGPPLQWQTFDITVQLPPAENADGPALLTVAQNGHVIHHEVETPNGPREMTIGLQDHINAMEFRNIWVMEE